MANRFHSDFRTRAATGEEPIAVLELTLDGTTYLYSDKALASISQGLYKPQIVNWGTLNYEASDRESRLSATKIDVTIYDTDLELTHLFMGAKARSLYGSTAKIILVYPGISTFANNFTIFTGGFYGKTYVAPRTWQLQLRLDDSALDAMGGDVESFTVNKQDFATSPADSWGKEVPIIYGKHDGDPAATPFSGVRGSIQGLYCSTNGDSASDTAPYRFVVAVGHIQGINEIYWEDSSGEESQGTPVKDTHWFWTNRGGKYYTEVGFTETQFTTDGLDPKTVTVNINGGLTTNAAGSTTAGDRILNPAKIIEHFLTNFIYNKWQGDDSWYTAGTDSPIDTTSITTLDTYFDDRTVYSEAVGSGLIFSGPALGKLNSWCQEYFVACWWNEEGKLQFGLRDPYDSDIYLDDNTPANWPWWRSEVHGVGNNPIYPLEEIDDKITNKWTYNYLKTHKEGGTYLASRSVQDFDRDSVIVNTLDCNWQRATWGEEIWPDPMVRRIRRDRFPLRRLRLQSNVVMLDPDLLDSVLISDKAGPVPESQGADDSVIENLGWGGDAVFKARLFSLLSTSIKLSPPITVTCVLEDERLFRATLLESGVGIPSGSGGIPDKFSDLSGFGTASNTWTSGTRSNKVCLPSDDGQTYFLAGDDTPSRSGKGYLFEATTSNDLANSCFVDGGPGTSAEWSATNGSQVSEDTSLTIFQEDILEYYGSSGTNQSLKLENVAGTQCNIYNTTYRGSLGTTASALVSVLYRDSSSAGCTLSVRRNAGSPNFWYNFSTDTWQSTQAFKNLTNYNQVWGRDWAEVKMGGTAASLQVFVTCPSGAGNYTNVGHIQLQNILSSSRHVYPRAVVLTDDADAGSTIGGGNDELNLDNTATSGHCIELFSQGTIRFIWTPLIAASDMESGTDCSLVTVSGDSAGTTQIMGIRYEPGGTDYFIFEEGFGDEECSITKSVSADTDYYIVARWDSTNNEFGSTRKMKFDVWDGSSWLTDEANDQFSTSLTTYAAIGGNRKAGTSYRPATGYIRSLEVLPFVLTDVECRDFP